MHISKGKDNFQESGKWGSASNARIEEREQWEKPF